MTELQSGGQAIGRGRKGLEVSGHRAGQRAKYRGTQTDFILGVLGSPRTLNDRVTWSDEETKVQKKAAASQKGDEAGPGV